MPLTPSLGIGEWCFPMKQEERIAQSFLRKLWPSEPQFEPDGQIPPDFALGGVGIEVRRLNQANKVNGRFQGTDEISYKLWPALEETFRAFDPLYRGRTYWVSVGYHHQFRRLTKAWKREIQGALQEFLALGSPVPYEKWLRDYTMLLRIINGPNRQDRTFRLASEMNFDGGGEVISVYAKNIERGIREKSVKVLPYKERYEEWWLALVDYMEWPLEPDEICEIQRSVRDLGLFVGVWVINRQGNLLLEIRA